jgi:hypothetical protein
MREYKDPYNFKTRLIVGLILGAIAAIVYGISELIKLF